MRLIKSGAIRIELDSLQEDQESLTQTIQKSTSVSEIEDIVFAINKALKNPKLEKFKEDLKGVRQKAYDRKRVLKIVEEGKKERIETNLAVENEILNEKVLKLQVELDSFNKIKPESPTKKMGVESKNNSKSFSFFYHELNDVFLFLAILFSICFINYLLISEMLNLYSASGFDNPRTSALAAAFMIAGAAIFNRVSPAIKYKVFLFLAIGYEAVFMISGTNEQYKMESLDSEELVFERSNYDLYKINYTKKIQRYENPNDKVFQNQWYWKNHIIPAKDKLDLAGKKYFDLKSNIRKSAGYLDFNSVMKLIFRLGLVFFNIFLFHTLIGIVLRKKIPHTSQCRLYRLNNKNG